MNRNEPIRDLIALGLATVSLATWQRQRIVPAVTPFLSQFTTQSATKGAGLRTIGEAGDRALRARQNTQQELEMVP